MFLDENSVTLLLDSDEVSSGTTEEQAVMRVHNAAWPRMLGLRQMTLDDSGDPQATTGLNVRSPLGSTYGML